MEFIKTDIKMLEKLFDMLDIPSNIKCYFCKKKVTPKTCGGIFPPLKNKKPIILCKSIICMTEYFCKLEEVEDEQNSNKPPTR